MLTPDEIVRSVFHGEAKAPDPTLLEGLCRAVVIGQVGDEAKEALGHIRPYLKGMGTDIGTRKARTIVKVGEARTNGDLFWLILAGDFGVWPAKGNLDLPPIKVKHPGEFFGEIVAFTDVRKRTATVSLQPDHSWGLLLELDAAVVRREARAGRSTAIELLLALMSTESKRLEQMDGIVMGLEARIRDIETTVNRRTRS